MKKVIEVINFLHELDLLEAHLDEHQHFMDEIIVVESTVTYSGMPKPALFQENRDRFTKYNVKYELIPAEMFIPVPGEYPESERKKWFDARRNNREIQQKYIFEKYKDRGDYFCNSDTDEIWDRNRWQYATKLMDQDYCYIAPKVKRSQNFIDVPGKSQEFWRITKSTMPTHVRIKGTKRGPTAGIGWHFSNCYKDPKDMWYKGVGLAQSMGYLGWKAVPSPSQLKEMMDQGIIPYLDGGISIDRINSVMPLEDLSWCAPFVANNKDMFPWVPEKWRKGKVIYGSDPIRFA